MGAREIALCKGTIYTASRQVQKASVLHLATLVANVDPFGCGWRGIPAWGGEEKICYRPAQVTKSASPTVRMSP